MPLEASLAAVEAQLQDVRAALLAADPLTLETATAQLRAAAATLAQALERAPARAAWPDGAQERVKTIAGELAMQRDQLARLLALTERQAASLLPPVAGVATYGSNAAPRSPTGARIYRAPG
jgi:hypothetical protein